jgi:hypothetical protein
VFFEVFPCVQVPVSAAPTRSAVSSASGVSCWTSGGGRSLVGALGWTPSSIPLVSRLGRTPAASVTTDPETTTAATATAAPKVVWERRRAEPARVMMEGRGQRTSSIWVRSTSRTGRMPVDSTSRLTANCAVAVWSSRSAEPREIPTSLEIPSSGSEVRWLRSSTRRWVTGSLARASRVAATSGSSPFIRLHQRAWLRRNARFHASGRT